MKVAVLFDALITKGGGDRPTLALAKGFNADIWTTNYIPSAVFPEYHSYKIFPHPLKSFQIPSVPPRFIRNALMEMEAVSKFRRMDLSAYDLIFTSGWWAKHVAVRDKNHPCIEYVHRVKEYEHLTGLKAIRLWYMKKLDLEAIAKLDLLVCNSEHTRKRIKEHYHRDAEVVYTAIDIKNFRFGASGDYFLSVQRISPEKAIETQLEVFRMVPEQKLIIVGTSQRGTESYFQKLTRLSPQNVTFLGSVAEDELPRLYSNAKAVIQTNPDEDLGVVPIEAMASGKPCLAPNAGGFKETILHGKTGILIDPPYAQNLAQAIKNFNPLDFDPNLCRERAELFSEERFIERMKEIAAKFC